MRTIALNIIESIQNGIYVPFNAIAAEWWTRARDGNRDGCKACYNQLSRALYALVRDGSISVRGYGDGADYSIKANGRGRVDWGGITL
jgi:hypothetical protein